MPGHFAFAHRLTQDAAYRALLAANRRTLHSSAAAVLRTLIVPGAPDEFQLLLQQALHLEAAADWRACHDACSIVLDRVLSTGRSGLWEEWEERAARAWELARQSDPTLPAESLLLLRNRGDLARSRGDYSTAQELLTRSLELARAAGRHDQAGHVLLALGRIATEQQRLPEAQRLMEESLTEMTLAGRRSRAAGTLISLGAVYFYQNDHAASERCLNEALELAEAQGDLRLLGTIHGNLGTLYLPRGETQRARESFERQLQLARAAGNRRGECWGHANLGDLAREQGELGAACEYYRRVLAQHAEIGDVLLERAVTVKLLEVLLALGERDSAAQELALAQERAARRPDPAHAQRLAELAAQLALEQ